LDNGIINIVLGPGNKECLLSVNLVVKLFEVRVALIHDVIGPGFYGNRIEYVRIMHICVGNVNIDRYRASQIKQGVHLDGTFGHAELCPWEQAQTQVNGSTVQRIDHIVNIQPEIGIVPI